VRTCYYVAGIVYFCCLFTEKIVVMDMKLLILLVVENWDQRLETKCCLSIDLMELVLLIYTKVLVSILG
jgi:hypothetical protein